MTKQEVVADAQKYADMAGKDIFILRRGNSYKASSIKHTGWTVEDVVTPVASRSWITINNLSKIDSSRYTVYRR